MKDVAQTSKGIINKLISLADDEVLLRNDKGFKEKLETALYKINSGLMSDEDKLKRYKGMLTTAEDYIKLSRVREEKKKRKELKETLDNYVLKGIKETEKNYTIKTRLGISLKEDKVINLPRVHRVGESLISYDIKIIKNNRINFMELEIEEYVEGTIQTEDLEVNYGWLAWNQTTSIYPTRFRLRADSGEEYEAISLTDKRFYNIRTNKHLSYGLYLINGLGVFVLKITPLNHVELSYIKGIPIKNQFKTSYDYRLTIIPKESLSVDGLIKYSNLENIKDEGELPNQD